MNQNEPLEVLTINQNSCPLVGFGTYPYQDQTCYDAVSHAIETGYKIIDTATYYRNFKPIGKALRSVEREDFFIISKVWPTDQTSIKINEDIYRTLDELQTSYLDVYHLHWPNHQIPIEETLESLDLLRSKELIRQIGMSNVTVNHLKRAMELDIPIDCIQVEMNPFFIDSTLIDFCQDQGIWVQAWAPLATGKIIGDPLLKQIGAKYGKTEAQVAIRWILEHNVVPLPASKTPSRIEENFNVFDFALTPTEIKEISKRASQGKRERYSLDRGDAFWDEFDFTYDKCWPKSR